MTWYAVIVCGGNAARMGRPALNKTLIKVAGVPSAVRCVSAFAKAGCRCILVIRPGDAEAFREALAMWQAEAELVFGGTERQHSVRKGIDAIQDTDAWVMIHDGARPLIDADFIRACQREAEAHGSAVPAIPVADTLRKKDGDRTVTVSREGLYRAQTPQCFRLTELKDAYQMTEGALFTDEAAMMEEAGYPVHLCRGKPENIKLTVREDCDLAEKLLQKTYRTGFGLDAHRFAEGRKLVLCGVEIPHSKGLLGHSDADAALHALTDALLGAAALGDIGKWFPDTDEKYRGISSLLLLEEAVRLITDRGWQVIHADVTIVCQAPKLAPYIEEMRMNVARALGVPVSHVSVKATTTERMGYEGREEGISAHAVATIAGDPAIMETEG